MTSPSEEEEESRPRGRPNRYFAEQAGTDTFGSNYRGVPVPHAGQQYVHPSDTKGAEDLCWCGEPLDHDWPGKSSGTKHPKGTSVTTMTEAPHVNRTDLRGYHRDLQEVIIAAVNQYGLRYKLAPTHIILYAKDGVATCRIAARNNQREVKRSREWFAEHVIGLDVGRKKILNPLVKDGDVLIEDLSAREKAEKKRQDAIEQTLRDEEEERLRVEQAEILRLAEKMNSEEHPVPKPPHHHLQELPSHLAPAEPEVSTVETEWVTYTNSRGEPDPRFQTNGTQYRCAECLGTPLEYVRDYATGLGGHWRSAHMDRTLLDSAETHARRLDTRRTNALSAKVSEAIDLLVKATGYQGDSAYIEELEIENERLRQTCQKVDEANRRAEEAEAKLALIKETMGL